MTIQEFKTNHWTKVKETIINSRISLRAALAQNCPTVRLSDYHLFIQQDPELLAEHNSVRQITLEMIEDEMWNVYNSETGQWASQNIQRKIKALETIRNTMIDSMASGAKIEIEVVYPQEDEIEQEIDDQDESAPLGAESDQED